jgi:hypothetical protein
MKSGRVLRIGEKSEERKIFDDLNRCMIPAAKKNNYDFVQKFIDL